MKLYQSLVSMLLAILLIFLSNCQQGAGEGQAEKIFYNGTIITLAKEGDTVEALAVKEGKILAAGSSADIMKLKGSKTEVIDLQGKTMLPGFIDAHSHISFGLNMVNQVNVSSPPVGSATDIPAILRILTDYQKEKNIPEGGWVVGWGYDQSELKEKRHITKMDLDKVLPNHKVMLIHVSAHGAVLNSKALEWAGIDANTKTPAGGIIARMKGSNEPEGLLMETAYLPVFSNMPKPNETEMLKLMFEVQQLYAKEGYTHAQDGAGHVKEIDFLQKAAAEGKVYLDIAILPLFTEMKQWMNNPKYPFGEYNNHVKLQGIKIVQDGAPQGKTACMTKAYLTGGPNGEKNWYGETTMPKDQFMSLVKNSLDQGLQVFVHANGDSTIDEAIAAVRAAGVTAKDDRRTVIIHSQFQRPEHLKEYEELGITPSYFTNHVFFWGDEHVTNQGEERASFISPLNAAKKQGLIFSNHSDFPVTPLNPFFMMWTAMARETRSGKILGADQRVDAYTALQALTTGPAYQIFEENRKGKIKAGFLADFVVLDKNPLKVDPMTIKEISVIETIKEGKIVYKKQ